ncbi:MAG: VOC family protein [Pseudomonadota bacterium]
MSGGSLPRISTIRLRVRDPDAQTRFYVDALGMRERSDSTIGYGDREAGLLFEQAQTSYAPSDDDIYWKISISVPDIDLAHDQLRAKGVEIEKPRQVLDVAYLAHLYDPEGFDVEFLDHWFKGERPTGTLNEDLLGGGPRLNLLTLRTHDADAAKGVATSLGMRPFYSARLPNFGFDLHFFGFGDEAPPQKDLYAIENRPWTYQRPETVLEIQHRHGAAPKRLKTDGEAGYAGAIITGAEAPNRIDELQIEARN